MMLDGAMLAQGSRWLRRLVVWAGLSLCLLASVGVSGASAATVGSEAVIARLTSATLEAHVNPEGKDTTCQAQYVSEEGFSQSGWTGATSVPCSPEDLGAGTVERAASASLTGLGLSTTYRYRFVTSSEGQAVLGAEESFATFGVARFAFEATGPFGPLGEPGEPVVQAGSHPFAITSFIEENTTQYKGRVSPDAIIKDVVNALPPGLIGNPAAMPRCPGRLAEESRCPAESQIGTVTVYHGSEQFGPRPLFDVIPPNGIAARFAGEINLSTDAYIDAGVRSGTDYGVTAAGYGITELASTTSYKIVFWGVPAEHSHDAERWCHGPGGFQQGCSVSTPPKPFLSLPTACLDAQSVTGSLDSYAAPGVFVRSTVSMPAVTGCARVPFAPSVAVEPSTGVADSASGLNVDVRVPQDEAPEGDATADLRDAVVTLPEGLVVDPSSADGLGACSEAQVGFTGFGELQPRSEPGVRTAQFTPGPAGCPDSSKIGTVEIDTPLLSHPVDGALYLAEQSANPFGSLLALYLTAYDPISGVVVKLAGLVQADPLTGRLTVTFDQNPQLPFEDLKVSTFNGPRAALTTPGTCGSYAAGSVLTPWSYPEGAQVSASSPPFSVSSAPGGGSCASTPAQQPVSVGFEAGTASPVAGSYSPFVLKLSREDGAQTPRSLEVTLPEGLLGKLAGIERCPEVDIQAAEALDGAGQGAGELAYPSCPAGSEVGVVHVGVGAGAPLFVTGRAYLAGAYKGAPFSLVIVTPAVAGPFDLGVVVVRAALYIDPRTARVTVRSDSFPSILDGIPLDIRSIAVNIDRSGFMLNPTSCEVMAVTGQAGMTTGQSAALSDRFQVGGCGSMPFTPALAASTQGKTSKKDGASLALSIKPGGVGQPNIRMVKLQLPVQLPSRIETLKLACPQAQFLADPAACPAGSVVGTASVTTPLLSVPLTGPAYLVSQAGLKFPEVVMVLQSEGLTIELASETLIEGGITTATAKSVPDAPFTSFALMLPQGPDSLLAAPSALCGQRLTMPAVIGAQNGLVLKQRTPVTVTGCPKKAAGLARAQKLTRALRACRAAYRHAKHKGAKQRARRRACERAARKRYGGSPGRNAKRPHKKHRAHNGRK